MKIVYITGCLGFMGSYITRKCLKLGWLVYGVDKITYAANPDLLGEFNKYPNFKFEKMDIKDLKHMLDCDYVINFAAESHVGNSIIDSFEFVNTNVAGVKNLLDLIRFKPENCSRRPLLMHISTDEVYGDIEEGEHVETDILKPSNPYSATKAASDMLILAWARTYGIKYNIMRPTNNYGIRQHSEKLVPLSIKNLIRGRKIRLHNEGSPVRNWLHADDTAEAVLTVLRTGNENEIYNISGNVEQKNIETARKIIQEFHGKSSGWEQHIDLSYVRPGQDVRYALSDKKLSSLGWSAKKDFDEELEGIVKFYKKQYEW